MNIQSKKMKGFSVIELLVYIGILTMALVVIVISVSSFGDVYNRIKGRQALIRSGSYAVERMIREIRSAESVTVGASTLGSHPGRLTLSIPLSGGSFKTSEFALSGGSIVLTENSVVTGSLTQSDITVSELVFTRIQTDVSEAVKLDLTLSQDMAGTVITSSFHGTAVLRASYSL